MRIAFVHIWGAGGEISDRVYRAAERACPDADRYTVDGPQSVTSLRPGPRLGIFDGESRVAPPPVYDCIFSTSPQAARQLARTLTGRQFCYLPPRRDEHLAAPARTNLLPLRLRGTNSPRQPSTASFYGREAGSEIPEGQQFIASSHAVRDHYRDEFHLEDPMPVLYPPVDVEFFCPGNPPREDFYLLVCAEGHRTVGLDLAVEACRMADRPLVLLGLEPGEAGARATHPLITCVPRVSPELLRDAYRRCRAVLATGGSELDISIIEAQACGTPVISLNQGCALELLVDAESSSVGTGLYFHEPTQRSLVSAMRELERRPSKFSASFSRAQSVRFSMGRFNSLLRNCLKLGSAVARDGLPNISGIAAAAVK